MTLKKIHASCVSIAISVILLSACATPVVERYYRLTYASNAVQAAESSEPKYELVVNQVQIPESINRPQMVLQKSPTESLVKDAQRWVAPLDEQITHAMVAHLRIALPESWLTESTESKASLPRFLLKTQIEKLLINAPGQVELEATWHVMDANRKVLGRQHKTIFLPLASNDYEAIAAGVSEAVRLLSLSVVQDISAVQNKKESVKH